MKPALVAPNNFSTEVALMMPEDGEPVSGFYRLARALPRLCLGKAIDDLELATLIQSFPAASLSNETSLSLVGKPVFVAGTVCCRDGARFVRVQKMRAVGPVDHVARLYLAKPEWVKNMDSMLMLIAIYESLSTPYQRLVDELFLDDLLECFLTAPASINGHHGYPGGLLDHAVDVARIVRDELERGQTSCDVDTAITAALLHDVGKTLEYEVTSIKGGATTYRLSTRGVLIGHKLTGMDLITQAAARLRSVSMTADCNVPMLTDDQLSGLIHAITASPAPDYVGIRNPLTPEANLISAADRMSADRHLYASLAPAAPTSGPWGRSHWHVGRRRAPPFFTRQIAS